MKWYENNVYIRIYCCDKNLNVLIDIFENPLSMPVIWYGIISNQAIHFYTNLTAFHLQIEILRNRGGRKSEMGPSDVRNYDKNKMLSLPFATFFQ